MSDQELIEERKRKVLHFLKRRVDIVAYVILSCIIALAVWIRVQPMRVNPATGKPGLWDIATDNWTLGPDLDPFLFLRWAKYIVEHGTLYTVDMMRYVPLGFNTKFELLLLPYLMAWFHPLASIFGSQSVTQSAVIFPVFMFALTVIAFFLLVYEIFLPLSGKKKSTIIALSSCLFLSILPPLLPRTIAGIPEKESVAFFLLFLTFFLFLRAWRSKRPSGKYLIALLAGLSTGAMAITWGGNIYIFVTLGLSLFIAFFMGQMDKHKVGAAFVWLVTTMIIMNLFSLRYPARDLATSTVLLIAALPIILFCAHYVLANTPLRKYTERGWISRTPLPVISLVIVAICGIIIMSFLAGPQLIFTKIGDITKPLVAPISDRLGVTVAENRQPFFNEWTSSFGPVVAGIPLFFWLFFFGSVYLFYQVTKDFSPKQRWLLTGSYLFFFIALIFSRYSDTSLFNGTNTISLLFYLSGILVLLGAFGFVYYRNYRKNTLEGFRGIDFGTILLFSLFFFSIVSARGSVRTIMVLVPVASIMVSYLAVSLIASAQSHREQKRIVVAVLAGVVVLASAYSAIAFYNESITLAESYIPSAYTYQWQHAMSWVRNSTPQNAVFAHWWDYGYWVQSIGERATVLDGGNAQVYWNHLLGRHVLTGESKKEGLEFMYAHNVTHLLIDSTEIGKYTAFSSIGSNEEYDRYSWISTFTLDPSQTVERKNVSVYIYQGQFVLDEDISYTLNGTHVFLPAGGAALLAVIVERNIEGEIVSAPLGVFVYQNNQIQLPIKHVFDEQLFDFNDGVEATIVMMPRLVQADQGIQLVQDGAFLYLSERVQNSNLAHLYLYGEQDSNYRLAHSEDDFIVKELKTQGLSSNDFVLFDSVRGPIKIWEINYPETIELRPEFLETYWPESLRRV